MKYKKIIYIPNAKLVLRDLINTKIFADDIVENNYFLFTSNLNIPKYQKISYQVLQKNNFRNHVWELASYLRRLLYEKVNFNFIVPNQSLEISKKNIFISKFAFFLKIEKFLLFFLDLILNLTVPKKITQLPDVKEVIFFGSSKDLNFDDIIYWAKKKKIHTKLIFTNWDNATTKPYKLKPDQVYCWGKATADLSSKIHNIKSNILGNVRFDKHLKFKKKYESFETDFFKKKLNIFLEKKIYLFAGVTFPFDEFGALKILDNVIKINKLNAIIVYKQHPYSRIKINEKDISKLSNIIKIDNNNFNNFENYFFLLNSIEAIISPFSTMVLEAMLFNKPSLCLAFNNKNQGVYNWNINALYQPHLKIMHEYEIPLWCYKIENLGKIFLSLYDNIEILKNKKEIYSSIVSKSVFTNDEDFNTRLNKILIS